jgi:large subunit ribosomal protein L30
MKQARQIRIRLVRSPIGARPVHRRTVQALGLRRRGSAVVREATPAILGMVRAISHLVESEEVSGSEDTSGSRSRGDG